MNNVHITGEQEHQSYTPQAQDEGPIEGVLIVPGVHIQSLDELVVPIPGRVHSSGIEDVVTSTGPTFPNIHPADIHVLRAFRPSFDLLE